jgi:chaperone required for assembly of F1-ATPase
LSPSPSKRVYKVVSVVQTPEGQAVHLDRKPVRTPAGKPLLVVGQDALMREIAREWDAQTEVIRPWTMPMTQLTATAVDRIAPERPTIMDHIVAYAQTDLLCYRALSPAGLRARQDELWQPMLDWLETHTGARLVVTEGIIAIDQPQDSLELIRAAFEQLDLWHLTAAQAAAAASGSAVLALGLACGRLNGQQVHDLAHLDDMWQIDQWGDDEEAAARRQNIQNDLLAAERFLRLINV